ncbi:MAG: dephospho-CoA kinase [Alphaproteobacteria bacterium]
MIVLGLTGSIGMGKSSAARALRRMGVPVHDSDAMVHRLLGPGGAGVGGIEAAFPSTVRDGAVDRAALGRIVFADPAALRRLERILHPLVGASARRFLRRHRAAGTPVVALDVPLLLETGGEKRCDFVIVVSAPAFLQRQRVLGRQGMTEARLAGILRQQMPDSQKRRRADAVVLTGLGKDHTTRQIARALARARAAGPRRGRRE